MEGLVLLEPTELYNILQQATVYSNLSDQNYLLLIGKLFFRDSYLSSANVTYLQHQTLPRMCAQKHFH